MLETCRWPKASLRVLSMSSTSTPRRLAVSRSIAMALSSPCICWSELTSQLGDFSQAPLNNGSPMSEIVKIVGLQGVLILSGASATTNAEVLNGLQIQSGAGD